MGYHTTKIEKGVLGESSKLLEEVLELQDAERQGAKIMRLCELADIYGALDYYLRMNYPGFKMHDLAAMAMLNERAFKDGERT
jgi:hypothetical protein